MTTTYHFISRSIDVIPKALSLLRRRLICVTNFEAHTENGVFDFTITVDLLEGHEERFMRLFEKIREIEMIDMHS